MNFSSSTMRTRGRSSWLEGWGAVVIACRTVPWAIASSGGPCHGCSVRLVWVTFGSAVLGLVGVCGSLLLGMHPLVREPWLDTHGTEAALVSLLLGACVAGITVLSSRVLVRRFGWARALHGTLRPVFARESDASLALMAIASGVGEELFFRGLLAPLLGVAVSSVVFGALHQVRGRGRWAWAAWATVLGAALAAVYGLTGHLVGAIGAHVAINAANLRYIRDTSLEPGRPRRLGGLLDRRV